jgi:hypothetical protein
MRFEFRVNSERLDQSLTDDPKLPLNGGPYHRVGGVL